MNKISMEKVIAGKSSQVIKDMVAVWEIQLSEYKCKPSDFESSIKDLEFLIDTGKNELTKRN